MKLWIIIQFKNIFRWHEIIMNYSSKKIIRWSWDEIGVEDQNQPHLSIT